MTEEEKVIEAARHCASCYFVKGFRDKLPDAMAQLDAALKKYYKSKEVSQINP